MASNNESPKVTAKIYALLPSPSKSILIEFLSLSEFISSLRPLFESIDELLCSLIKPI